MATPPFRVLSPRGRPDADAVLQRFLRGLAARTGPRRPGADGPDAARAVRDLLAGGPPGLDAAELAGRLAGEVLRAAGDGPLHTVLGALAAGRHAPRPRWDRGGRALWWGGALAKRLRHDAANQAAVLDAFQARGWPPAVAVALPPRAGLDPKARRREAVRGLNHGLRPGTVRFLSDDATGGVRWEADPLA